jgi:hypothetical protein
METNSSSNARKVTVPEEEEIENGSSARSRGGQAGSAAGLVAGRLRELFGDGMKVAFERVGEDGAQALERDFLELMRSNNRAGDRALVAPAEYLEVVAVRA